MTRQDLAYGALVALVIGGATWFTRDFVIEQLFHRPPLPIDEAEKMRANKGKEKTS